MNAPAPLLESLLARGFTVAPEQFSIGRPDRTTLSMRTAAGARVVVKQLPSGSAKRVFATMRQLWDSSFGAQRECPGLPQPIALLPELDVIVMEWIGGAPLAEKQHLTEQDTECSIRLLAALHDSGVIFESRRSSRGIVRSAQRKAAKLGEFAPEHGGLVTEVIAKLEDARTKDTELVPSHGDFSPRNVLVGGERPVIIDWERAQMADPARDVAYFATWPWLERISAGESPDERGFDKALAVYLAARPQARLDRQVRFHIAAGMLRRACSLVELWPEQAYLVPALLKTALRQLE